jgi:ribosome-binding factor A
MSSRRRERLNELIKREVSKKIIAEVKDPRIGFVTVTKAEIHDDMTGADVYITVMDEDPEKINVTVKALNHMSGFFQKDLGEIMRTRLTPVICFKKDMGAEQTFGIDRLIIKARESDMDHQDENE